MYWGNHMGGWGYILMALNMVAFWGLLVAAIVLLARYLGGTGRQTRPTAGSDPQRVLAERYARGEIDEEEYQRRAATLRGSGHP